jgi:hypothetical protein
MAELTAELVITDPAPRAEIRAAETALGVRFPPDYVDFLTATNGGRGPLGGALVELWPVTALRAENAARLTPEGLVVFGQGARGALLAFRDGRYLLLPAGSGLTGADEVGSSLLELLELLTE